MPATVKIAWSEEEDAHLLTMRLLGYTNRQIGDSVGRPRSTTGHRIIELSAKLTDKEKEELLAKRPIPDSPAPVFRCSTVSMKAPQWTDDIDNEIIAMRGQGFPYRRIGKLIGRSETSVYDRIKFLSETESKPEFDKKLNKYGKVVGSGRADYFKKPSGQPPKYPDAFPHPNRPAWRKCLGEDCGKVFWSQHAGNRRCQNCRSMMNRADGSRAFGHVDDSPELTIRR